jgi:hypothetical protein
MRSIFPAKITRNAQIVNASGVAQRGMIKRRLPAALIVNSFAVAQIGND